MLVFVTGSSPNQAAPTARPMAPPTLHEHAAMLRRYLHVLGAGADRVDDLLQEVFVVALHKLVDDRGAAAAASFLRVDALRSCIDGLPERSRELLRRCYADDAGRHELGDEFGLAVDGVKTALRRLRAALRECIERRIRGGS